MRCVVFSRDMNWATYGVQIQFRRHPGPGKMAPERIYCTSPDMVDNMISGLRAAGHGHELRQVELAELRRLTRVPTYLGGTVHPRRPPEPMGEGPLEHRVSELASRHAGRLKLALFNGVGNGIGDNIAGLAAWRATREWLSSRGLTAPEITLLAQPYTESTLRRLFLLEPSIKGAEALPVSLARLQRFDGYWDFGEPVADPEFDRMPMVDWFLSRIGIDPAEVPAEAKSAILPAGLARAPKGLARRLAGLPGPRLGIHATASSSLRTIPAAIVSSLIERVLAETPYSVVSTCPLALEHPRVLDLSSQLRNLSEYCWTLSQVDALISADTSAYHIAAAYGIPTLALFATIPPRLRVAYYPSVDGIEIVPESENRFLFVHGKHPEATDDRVQALWSHLDPDVVLARLEAIVQSSPKLNR